MRILEDGGLDLGLTIYGKTETSSKTKWLFGFLGPPDPDLGGRVKGLRFLV